MDLYQLAVDQPRLQLPSSEMDPLREDDSLREAQILRAHFDVARGSLALMFEMRTAIQIRDGEAALLAVNEVDLFEWSTNDRAGPRMAWNVIDW